MLTPPEELYCLPTLQLGNFLQKPCALFKMKGKADIKDILFNLFMLMLIIIGVYYFLKGISCSGFGVIVLYP